ncbi:unnamed protein product, partial [marine sediment metagenome]
QCLYEEITGPKKKNHGIISSISLLKLVENKFSKKIKISGMDYNEALEHVFVPSALAIAIHDDNLWSQLKEPKKWKEREGKCPLPNLKFDDDPLSFLLIFCDVIQEWGRPSKSKTEDMEEKWKHFYLRDISYEPTEGFDLTVHTPHNTRDEKFFIDKEKELRETALFLKQPDSLRFIVHLIDKNGKGQKEGFIMDGGC